MTDQPADAAAPLDLLLAASGGASVVRGARHPAADLATPPRVPSTVAPDAFEVGVDLAVTPGAVVLRTPMFELPQYRPQTPRVRRVPLLVVPPTINRYSILDLAPGRSLVEYLVAYLLCPDYVGWLERRGGGEKARPRRLGGGGLPPMEPAPGTDVLDR